MSVVTPIPPWSGPLPAPGPAPKVWALAQFHYLGDLGLFEGRRAMLINGVIVEEGSMNPPHTVAGEKTEDAVQTAFGLG